MNLATGKGGQYGRQTGSALQAVRARGGARERHLSPSTIFSAPASIDIPLDNGTVWHVTNAEGSGYGSMSLESATINSVNTVYAQLIEQLGRRERGRDRRAHGHAMLPAGERTAHAAVAVPVGGARHERGQHAGDGGRLRHARDRWAARRTRAGDQRHRRPGRVLWQATPKSEAGRGTAGGHGRQRHPAGGRVVRHRDARRSSGDPRSARPAPAETHTNAWFVGAIPQLTAAVWVGFREGSIPMEPPAPGSPCSAARGPRRSGDCSC